MHDLLDRIYFEGDVLARYTAVLPPEMRAKVTANLHAFMEIALSVDAGRYPSLPRFLQELRELRDSSDDAPDEGKLGTAGDAVRIYTVHESKGLEAPIVWLLDANAEKKNREGNDVLLDWPTRRASARAFLPVRRPGFARQETRAAVRAGCRTAGARRDEPALRRDDPRAAGADRQRQQQGRRQGREEKNAVVVRPHRGSRTRPA